VLARVVVGVVVVAFATAGELSLAAGELSAAGAGPPAGVEPASPDAGVDGGDAEVVVVSAAMCGVMPVSFAAPVEVLTDTVGVGGGDADGAAATGAGVGAGIGGGGGATVVTTGALARALARAEVLEALWEERGGASEYELVTTGMRWRTTAPRR
jgi:hypothetical protein